MKSILLRGGVLLALSAIGSKLFALWRDRLFVEIFGAGQQTDLIFASFRIPDFFYFLLVGLTLSTLLIPRMAALVENREERIESNDDNMNHQIAFFSSFLWGVGVCFGIICILGIFGAQLLIPLVATGFSPELHAEMLPLVRTLFGSVFILALSSVFAAFLQYKQRFIAIALAPIFYTSIICLILFFVRDQFSITTTGIAALIAACCHLLITMTSFFKNGGTVGFFWLKPLHAWKNFKGDFFRRVMNNAAFQINQTADVIIASFLAAGSVAAFSLGSNLGHFLLSILGYSSANAAFPRLAEKKHDHPQQLQIIWDSAKWILFFSIPGTLICALFPELILQLIFGLEDEALQRTKTVFFWTVLSLPAGCFIPLLARFFLANDDTKTPLFITSFSLIIATTLAAVLSLYILPKETAILGLALGNFTANYLSAGLFGIMVWRKVYLK